MKNFLIIFGFLLIFTPLYAQETEEEYEVIRKDLDRINKEIEILEKKIEDEQRREKQKDRSINDLGIDIYRRQVKINRLKRAERKTQQSINYIKKEISKYEEEIKYMRELLRKRIIHLYKYGKTNEIEAILLSDSFTKVLIRLKYIMFLMDRDKNNIQKIREDIKELNNKNEILLRDLESRRELIAKRERENKLLAIKQEGLRKEKEKIKNNKELYSTELKKKEASQRRLLNMFSNLGKAGPEVPILPPSKGAAFATLKGRLIWPVRGKIISHYGVSYNKELRTRKNNLGIDIQSPFGSDVYCVGYGMVREPLWLPGYGPILIIEHDDGYITSYAHLAEILVELNEIVTAGHVIGKVGDVESFEGPKLNFQLWRGGTNLNPEMWLDKRRVAAAVD